MGLYTFLVLPVLFDSTTMIHFCISSHIFAMYCGYVTRDLFSFVWEGGGGEITERDTFTSYGKAT